MTHKLHHQARGSDLIVNGYRLRLVPMPEPDISLEGRLDNLPNKRYNKRNRIREAILRHRTVV